MPGCTSLVDAKAVQSYHLASYSSLLSYTLSSYILRVDIKYEWYSEPVKYELPFLILPIIVLVSVYYLRECSLVAVVGGETNQLLRTENADCLKNAIATIKEKN